MNYDLHMMLIGLKICEVTSAKDLPNPCRLIDHVTDEDRAEGVRRYFADDGISEDDVALVVLAYKKYEREQAQIHGICDALIASILG